MANWWYLNRPKRPYRPRPKWRNLGKAWEPYKGNRRQERKYRQARAFTIRGEWKYSRERTKEREKQVKKGVRAVVGVNVWLNNVAKWIKAKLGLRPFRPERIDPEKYVVEVGEYEQPYEGF